MCLVSPSILGNNTLQWWHPHRTVRISNHDDVNYFFFFTVKAMPQRYITNTRRKVQIFVGYYIRSQFGCKTMIFLHYTRSFTIKSIQSQWWSFVTLYKNSKYIMINLNVVSGVRGIMWGLFVSCRTPCQGISGSQFSLNCTWKFARAKLLSHYNI